MAQTVEHCKLIGSTITYLGRAGIFEDKGDKEGSEARAWDKLEKEGWELVSVATDNDGHLVHYFKRSHQGK